MTFTDTRHLYRYLYEALLPGYGSEARSLALLLAEELTGLERSRILAGRPWQGSPEKTQRLAYYLKELGRQVPVQYLLGKAHFYGREFRVNRHTLIPRPETEELVQWALEEARHYPAPAVLDIGTGSGCIAITLALELPPARIDALEVSPQALGTARQNARRLEARVRFIEADLFAWQPGGTWNLWVSNPPYVTEADKHQMTARVVEHEPPLALYVPDDDPLRYYHRLVTLAPQGLMPGGRLLVEVNERLAGEVARLFTRSGLQQVEIRQDLSGRERLVGGLLR